MTVLSVKPTDILIYSVGRTLGIVEAERMMASIKSVLPEGVRCMVIGGDTKVAVVEAKVWPSPAAIEREQAPV